MSTTSPSSFCAIVLYKPEFTSPNLRISADNIRSTSSTSVAFMLGSSNRPFIFPLINFVVSGSKELSDLEITSVFGLAK